MRYGRDKFPEDLRFQETTNRQFFQGRYVIRHPYRGEMTCSAAQAYRERTYQRQEAAVQTLAKLTGWEPADIRRKVDFIETNGPTPTDEAWWDSIW